MMALAWITFLVLVGFYFSDLLSTHNNPNQELQSRVSATGAREVALQRNRQGHYVTSGLINGQPVVFMLDTGATSIAIPEAVARRLELPRGRAFPVRTANGTSRAFQTSLSSVSVGTITLGPLDAAITPGLGGNEILLGMSFLGQLEFSQRDNSLILRQHP